MQDEDAALLAAVCEGSERAFNQLVDRHQQAVRNFLRRVELCFPVLDKKLKQRVINEGLKPYLKDNRQAWDMNAEGQYVRKISRGTLPRSAQLTLLGELAQE